MEKETKVHRGEITSHDIPADNPVHQRLFYGYFSAKDYIKGDILELGCGTGRGFEILLNGGTSYTGIDKNDDLIADHGKKYPQAKFINSNIPPFVGIEDNSMDTVVTFHVIEHIKDDSKFMEEIYRVLKPGGLALVSTPNRKFRIARNPWHIREYMQDELRDLALKFFPRVEMKGIAGNEKVMQYFDENRASVNKVMKFDIFRLQYILPGSLLRMPYEYMNKKNRQKLHTANSTLAESIDYTDYFLSEDANKVMDHFMICHKD